MNQIQTWQQGRFVDQSQYAGMSEAEKEEHRKTEAHLVRPAATENAICHCPDPRHAAWIAQRLNLASKLEKMSYDFATGKSDGSEIVDLVKNNID